MFQPKHHDGSEPVHFMLYTLSTCGWCKKTKTLLEELGIGYDYVDLDLLVGDEKAEVRKEVEKWNPSCSFPTLVINDSECLVGFKEARIREILGK